MKRLLYAAALLLCMSAMVVSCNKDSGGSSSSIVGTWKIVWNKYDNAESEFSVGTILTFEKGGTVLFDGFPYMQYRYDASTTILKMGGSVTIKVLSLTSKKMTWGNAFDGDEKGELIILERQ